MPMLSAYSMRYRRATWTEKKDGDKKSRKRRAWDMSDRSPPRTASRRGEFESAS
jgi:hypothetical protein